MAKGTTFEERIEIIQRSMDSTHPEVRNFAASIAAGSPWAFNVGQISLLWLKVRTYFKYVNDPRGYEYNVPASENIRMGLIGDCDDAAILMASLIEAVGGMARLILATGVPVGHAYAECYVGKLDYLRKFVVLDLAARFPFIRTVHCHQDAVNGCWLNMDTLGDRHPGSPLFESSREYAVYTNGRWEAI